MWHFELLHTRIRVVVRLRYEKLSVGSKINKTVDAGLRLLYFIFLSTVTYGRFTHVLEEFVFVTNVFME